MHGGLGVPERRLILEVGGLVAMGISAVGLGRLWFQSKKIHAEQRQKLIRRLFEDPSAAVRAREMESKQAGSKETLAVRAASAGRSSA